MEVEFKILFDNQGLLSTFRLSYTDLKTNTFLSYIVPQPIRQQNKAYLVLSSPNLEDLQLEKFQKKIHSKFVVPCLSSNESAVSNDEATTSKSFWVKSLQHESSSDDALALIRSIEEGFESGYEPELCEEGVNGTYFLKDKNGNKIGVFKPQDEEGNSPSNPKKSGDSEKELELSKGIKQGEAALREVAAYLLDSAKFHEVPITFMAKISHPSFKHQTVKTGSLQSFVKHDGCSEDISVHMFPVNEVHKIGILDIIVLNMDRHSGNILYQKTKNGYKLLPIDHGFSLPDYTKGDESCFGNAWFDWFTWGQAKQKFSEESKKYIESIDVEDNIRKLTEKLNMSAESMKTMRISTMLLKKGAEKNLTLYDIASMLCRQDLDQPSCIELLCRKAEGMVDSVDNREELFIQCLSKLMDEQINMRK